MKNLLTIISVIVIRVILEYALIADHSLEPFQSILSISLFFLTIFSAALLIAVYSTKCKPSEALAFLAKISPLILLPLLIDVIASAGQPVYYGYATTTPSLEKLASLCYSCEGLTIGIKIEVIAFLAAMAYFVYSRTRKALNAAASAIALYACLFAMLFIPQILFNPADLSRPVVLNETLALYAIATTLLTLALLCLENKKTFFAFASKPRLSRSLHYVALFLTGAFLTKSTLIPLEASIRLLAGILSTVFAFQAAGLLNDFFDEKIDAVNKSNRPLANNKKLFETALFFFLSLAFINSLAIGYEFTLLLAAGLCLSFLYSSPPLRLRNHFTTASLSIALISTLAIYAGASAVSINPSQAFNLIPLNLAAMFFISVLLASNVKDLKDEKGDAANGVKTIPVLLKEKSRLALSLLVALAFLIVPLLSTLALLPYAVLFTLTASAALLFVKNPLSAEAWFFTSYFLLLLSFLFVYKP